MKHRFASNIIFICTVFLLTGAWLATPAYALPPPPPTADDFEFFARASSGQTFGSTVCDTTVFVCRLTGDMDETTYMFAYASFERNIGGTWTRQGTGGSPSMQNGFLTVTYPWSTPPDKNSVAVSWRAKIEVDDINAMETYVIYKDALSLTPDNIIIKATGDPIILHDSADTSHTIPWTITHYVGSGIDPDFDASVRIYNLSGQLVTTLTKADVSTGADSVTWNTNLPQTDGIYTYKIDAGHEEPMPDICADADKSALLTPAVNNLYYLSIFDDGQGGHLASCVLKYTLNRAAGACEFKIYGTDFSGPTVVSAPSLVSGTHYTSKFTMPVTVDANDALTGQYYVVVFAEENSSDAGNNRDQLAKPALQKGTTTLTSLAFDLTSDTLSGYHFMPVTELNEETEGAYVHYNLDNDNASDNAVGAPKHPGWDLAEITDAVSGDNDLILATATLATSLNTGVVKLIRSDANIKVWTDAEKAEDNELFVDTSEKSWDLSNATERAAFHAIKGSLWVEGAGNNAQSQLKLQLEMPAGTLFAEDIVKLTSIAADCGQQPTTSPVNQRADLGGVFPGLIHCEWSITDAATPTYNCIAWSVGWDTMRVFPEDIDLLWGNDNGHLTMDEVDAFYADVNLTRIQTGSDEEKAAAATAMYYPPRDQFGQIMTNWEYENNLRDSGYHGARRHSCSCGCDKWIMYESKCGQLERLEHVWDQLNGSAYGSPAYFYH